jgi:hypothetical protein
MQDPLLRLVVGQVMQDRQMLHLVQSCHIYQEVDRGLPTCLTLSMAS